MSTTLDIDSTIVDVSVVVPYEVTATASVVLPVVYEAQESVPPTIDNVEILEVSGSSIEISFDVDRQGATECVKGVLWSTTNPPTFSGGDYRLQYGDGNVDIDIAGLLNNTTYYLRPYALSNLGYTYGDVVEQATGANPIPKEYQLVEYLESTGTQYIDTLYTTNNNSIIEIEGRISQLKNGAFYGSYGDYVLFGWNYSQNALFWQCGSGKTVLIKNRFDLVKHKYLIDCYNKKILIDDIAEYGYNYAVSNSNTAYIFIPHNQSDNRNGWNEVYHLSIKEGDIYLRDYYPVYRKSDSVAGMYDIVNNVFYTNQGSGEFTVGADKEWEEEE